MANTAGVFESLEFRTFRNSVQFIGRIRLLGRINHADAIDDV